MRLTLLCGGIILVSGGALLGIAFALGSRGQSLDATFIERQVGISPFVPRGFGPGGTVTVNGGGGVAGVERPRVARVEIVDRQRVLDGRPLALAGCFAHVAGAKR